jgi:hypothetical protein
MLPLFDTKRAALRGGYRVPYDPSAALSKLGQGHDTWDELWSELHHQGDVGEASYAAVPHLVEIAAKSGQRSWNFYALVSTIEIERHRTSNPALPGWVADDYFMAIRGMQRLALNDLPLQDDPLTVRVILAALALCRGQVKLGALISFLDESELDEFVDEQLSWADLYSPRESLSPSGLPTFGPSL